MRKFFIISLFLIFALPIMAENATNIRVRHEGKAIVITYDLSKNSVVHLLMASGKSNQYTELKAVTGNVGKSVPAGQNRKIVWKPLEEYETFIAENVRFKVETQSAYEYYTQNAKIKTLVSGQFGYSVAPQLSYGVMIGQMYKGIGWYITGRSNFHFQEPTELRVDHQGFIDGNTQFYTGNVSKSHYVIIGGVMVNFLEWSRLTKNKFNTFGLYIGGGYGKREIQWETTDGHWAEFNGHASTSFSGSGFSGNVGLFGSVYGVTINVGMGYITEGGLSHCEVELGIGYMF
jgi:hypothetical protein